MPMTDLIMKFEKVIQIPLSEFPLKRFLAERSVMRGKRFLITRNGEPIAFFLPTEDQQQTQSIEGLKQQTLSFAEFGTYSTDAMVDALKRFDLLSITYHQRIRILVVAGRHYSHLYLPVGR